MSNKNDTPLPLSTMQRYRNLPKSRKYLIWFALSLLTYTLLGFFVIPPLTRVLLEKKLPEILGRECSVNKVKLNPFTLTATIEGFSLKKKETANSEDFVSFEQLSINLESTSLFKRALIIKSVSLLHPAVHFKRYNNLTYSFSDLLQKPDTAAKEDQSNKPFLFSVNNIQLHNGAVYFDDRPKDKTHQITKLEIAIPAVSNLPYLIGNYIQPAFSATINNTEFSLNGDAKPFTASQQTELEIDITGINLPKYLAYIPNPTDARLLSGLLDLKGRLAYLNRPSALPELSFTGLLSLRDITISDTDSTPYIKFPEITVQLSKSSLLDKEIKIKKLAIDKPEFTITRMNNGKIAPLYFMLPDTADQSPANDKAAPAEELPLSLSVSTFTISEATVLFTDNKATSFSTVLKPINLTIDHFSTLPEQAAAIKITAMSESGEDLSLHGTAQLSPIVVSGGLSVKNIELPKYEPYLKQIINPQVKTGKLNIATAFMYLKGEQEDEQLQLTDIGLELQQFDLNDDLGELLSLPSLKILKSSVDLEKKQAIIGEVKIERPELHIFKKKNGEMNIANLLKAQSLSDKTNTETISPEMAGDPDNTPWVLSLKKAALNDAKVAFNDNSLEHPASMEADKITITINDLTTSGEKASLSFDLKINKDGNLRGKGTLDLNPFALSLDLDAKNLGLPPLQPYVNEQLNLIITGGEVNLKGNLALIQKKDAAMNTSFSGTASIANFTSIDTIHGNDLAKWTILDFSGLAFSNQPQALSINTITMKDIFTRLEVEENGELNFSSLLKTSKTKQDKSTSAPPKSPTVTIDKVILSEAGLEFIDHKIKPSYNAAISTLSGEIRGLSSSEESLAEVDIYGKINQHSPLTITGKVNPFKEPLYADLNLAFHDIDLSPTSPYTGKHIGYKTKKGKLTLNLHYLIDNKKIEATNEIFLDQFTLGENVNSSDAVNLPINLALALLKNRRGEITLDIPIQGDLNDPEFSVSGVVAKVIFNIITKAVSSPFALLAALIPDGGELQYVTFEPGRSELQASESAKLEKMAKVLFERPGLRVDIVGKVSPSEDKKELIDTAFNRLLKLEKARRKKIQVIEGESTQLDQIEISDDEYPRYLEMAYKAMLDRNNPRSRGEKAWGLVKGLFSNKPKTTPEEMKEALIVDADTNDDTLRLLAHKRAESVLQYLASQGEVESERLFIVEPQLPEDTGDETQLSGMKVELVIK